MSNVFSKAPRTSLWIALFLLACGCRSRDNAGRADKSEASRPTSPASVTGASRNREWTGEKTMEGLRLVRSFSTVLDGTAGLAVDGRNRCYVAHDKGVAVFDENGERLGGWEVEGGAVCVDVGDVGDNGDDGDVGDDGRLVLCGPSTVSIYDAEGVLKERWGEEGEGQGEFRLITGVALTEGMVFLADAGNRCVHRFAVTGDFANDLGRKGETEGQGIICPSPYLDCDVDEEGRLHVTNPGRFRIDVMASDGRPLFHWGKPGVERGFFHGCCNPTHLCLLPGGRTAAALKRPPGILVFDRAEKGKEPRLLAWADPPVFSKEDQGLDLAGDAENRLWALDVGAGAVFLFALELDGEEN